MKKFMLLIGFVLLLSGCAASETFETLGPVIHQSEELPAMAAVELSLPDSASAQTFGGATDALYECDGYTIVRQTLASGDFYSTMRTLSGCSPEDLTVLESGTPDTRRYDWVWTAVGEDGDLICRAAVLDDGNYHYCVCTIAPATEAGKLTQAWNALFASFRLEESA